MSRNYKVLVLTEELISILLDLPPDTSVQGVRDDFMRNAVLVRLHNERFEEVAEGTEPPLVLAHVQYNYATQKMEVTFDVA